MNYSSRNEAIREAVKEAVKEALGLEYLVAGNCLLARDSLEFEDYIWIDYIWIININGYYKYDLNLGVAAVRKNRHLPQAEFRGFLLPSLAYTHIHKHYYKYVSLENEPVTIKEILQCSNLLPETENQPPDSLVYNFSIHTFVPGGSTVIEFDSATLPIDSQSQKLWNLAIQMVTDLAYKTGLYSIE